MGRLKSFSRKIGKIVFPLFVISLLGVISVDFFAKNANASTVWCTAGQVSKQASITMKYKGASISGYDGITLPIDCQGTKFTVTYSGPTSFVRGSIDASGGGCTSNKDDSAFMVTCAGNTADFGDTPNLDSLSKSSEAAKWTVTKKDTRPVTHLTSDQIAAAKKQCQDTLGTSFTSSSFTSNKTLGVVTSVTCKGKSGVAITANVGGNGKFTASQLSELKTYANAKSTTNTNTKCALTNGMGFIICPVMWLAASVIDGIYGVLANVLDIPSDLFTNNAVNAAYSTFLPYANILLVIVFLLVIYSEATGNGFGALSNYSIKKTLPRLIVFAILINIAFYICAAAVDVSNIVGSGVYTLFAGGGRQENSLTTQFEKVTNEATSNPSYGGGG